MDLTIPKENIRVFYSIITCLSKVAEHVDLCTSWTHHHQQVYNNQQPLNTTTEVPLHEQQVLKLYCVNSVQSAYMEFNLTHEFFKDYNCRRNKKGFHAVIVLKHLLNAVKLNENTDELRLYVPFVPSSSSSTLSILLNESVLNKNRSAIGQEEEQDNDNSHVDSSDHMLYIESVNNSTNRLKKTFKLPLVMMASGDRQRASYDESMYSHYLVDDRNIMAQCLANFPVTVHEMSISLHLLKRVHFLISLKSYTDPLLTNFKSQTVTNTSVSVRDFSDFQAREIHPMEPQLDVSSSEMQQDAEVGQQPAEEPRSDNQDETLLEMTFNLRDFKAFVNFCTSSHQSVELFLAEQGKPILFRSYSDETSGNDIEAVCLLATVDERPIESQVTTTTPSISYSISTPGATPYRNKSTYGDDNPVTTTTRQVTSRSMNERGNKNASRNPFRAHHSRGHKLQQLEHMQSVTSRRSRSQLTMSPITKDGEEEDLPGNEMNIPLEEDNCLFVSPEYELSPVSSSDRHTPSKKPRLA